LVETEPESLNKQDREGSRAWRRKGGKVTRGTRNHPGARKDRVALTGLVLVQPGGKKALPGEVRVSRKSP